MNPQIRPYRSTDAEVLSQIYRESVISLGAQYYTPEQVRVWAMHPENMDDFRRDLAEGITLVAELPNKEVVAFGQLNPPDYIAYLYCHPAYARHGIGSALYRELETVSREAGKCQIWVEASHCSRPLLEKFGFQVVATEHPVRHGVVFERFRMEKILT